MKTEMTLAALLMGVAMGASGQEAAPQAVDPIYTAAVPTAEQVKRLQALGADWPQLARYREENARLAPPAAGERRVVFYGDSITDSWGRRGDETKFFPGKPYVNRGISGQTTAQMLVRFEQDVVHLKPAVVVILAGTNDLAGNTGLASLEMIEDNFQAMVAIAKASGIRVVLASVLPATDYPWRRGLQPAAKIKTLNAWMKTYAGQNGCVYLDYHSAMSNAAGGLDPKLAEDGVHPTAAGYAVMAPLAERAIEEALGK